MAIAALVAGLAVAARQWRVPRSPGVATPVTEPDTSERVIGQALEHAPPVDSTEYKQRWIDEVRNVDLAGLDARRVEIFIRHANAQQCTCGCGYTLAGCRASDMTCDVSGARLEALRDSVRAGHITSARGIRARPRSGG
ncbi:MAG TPA: hypothetical protein VJY35_11220 [Candidatus Eisenbacteria bacterium]|nr:hypothetical protein [Candidatus Eisenbacteria bacterium]